MRIGIERLVLRRTARLKNEDDRLRLPGPWTAFSRLRLKSQQVRQPHADQPHPTDLQQVAPSEPRMIRPMATHGEMAS